MIQPNTNNSDLDVVKERTLYLSKAQSLLNERYLKQKSEAYKQWQQDSHQMWITQGILLPFASSFIYPTQAEIVAKALELYNEDHKNIKPSAVSQVAPVEPAPITLSKPVEISEVTEPEVSEVSEPVEVSEVLVDTTVDSEVDVISENDQTLNGLQDLNEKARHNSNLRKLLAQFITVAKELDLKTNKEQENDIQ